MLQSKIVKRLNVKPGTSWFNLVESFPDHKKEVMELLPDMVSKGKIVRVKQAGGESYFFPKRLSIELHKQGMGVRLYAFDRNNQVVNMLFPLHTTVEISRN